MSGIISVAKELPIFRDDSFFTDDTVMTCAVAKTVTDGGHKNDFVNAMKKYVRVYQATRREQGSFAGLPWKGDRFRVLRCLCFTNS